MLKFQKWSGNFIFYFRLCRYKNYLEETINVRKSDTHLPIARGLKSETKQKCGKIDNKSCFSFMKNEQLLLLLNFMLKEWSPVHFHHTLCHWQTHNLLFAQFIHRPLFTMHCSKVHIHTLYMILGPRIPLQIQGMTHNLLGF